MFIPNNQYIQNALKDGLPANADRFFRTRFDNADENHISSVKGHLSRVQMIELKASVDEIIQFYNQLTKNSIMTKEQRDLSKLIYIYNYLLENVMYTQCQFVPNGSNVFGGNPYKNSIYGAIVLHDAVCEGISEAFDCLCKVMDIKSMKLLSSPNDPWGGGHAFNAVKLGEIWYKIDAALEIGLISGHKIKGGAWRDKQFLVPFSESLLRVCPFDISNCISAYSRENITIMKNRLKDRGLSFEYLHFPNVYEGKSRLPVTKWKPIGSELLGEKREGSNTNQEEKITSEKELLALVRNRLDAQKEIQKLLEKYQMEEETKKIL